MNGGITSSSTGAVAAVARRCGRSGVSRAYRREGHPFAENEWPLGSLGFENSRSVVCGPLGQSAQPPTRRVLTAMSSILISNVAGVGFA